MPSGSSTTNADAPQGSFLRNCAKSTPGSFVFRKQTFDVVDLNKGGQQTILSFTSICRENRLMNEPEVDPGAAVGDRLQAAVDGRIVEFDEGGRKTRTASIPPAWEGPPRTGNNDGAAGVWFGDRNNIGKIGGQTASEIRLVKATSLLDP